VTEGSGLEKEAERYEHVVSWMMEMYSRGQVPTIEAICRSFGLTPAEALACMAEFHKRFPIAFPITFQVATKNPRVFWGMGMPIFGMQKKVRRLGPPGVAVIKPYRRFATILFLAGIILVTVSLVLMGLYGGVP